MHQLSLTALLKAASNVRLTKMFRMLSTEASRTHQFHIAEGNMRLLNLTSVVLATVFIYSGNANSEPAKVACQTSFGQVSIHSGSCPIGTHLVKVLDTPSPQGAGSINIPPPQFIDLNNIDKNIQRNTQEADKHRAEEQESVLRQLEIEQRRRDLDRQNSEADLRERRRQMDQRLMGLAHDDESISKETETLILGLLSTALDMDKDHSTREWGPTSWGSTGTVNIQETKRNIVGETCRLFTITMRRKGQSYDRSISGNVCRRDNKWVWQAPQLQ